MQFIAPEFRATLDQEGLHTFADVWGLERNWVQKPNARRGGTSGVCRKVLKSSENDDGIYFVKYQENHCCRTLKHPLRGTPTAGREAMNLLLCEASQVQAPKLMLYDEQREGSKVRAILITRKLEGISLRQHLRRNPFNAELAQRIAQLIYKFHVNLGYEHRALVPKHIWVDGETLALLDLEQARPWWHSGRPLIRDLDPLLEMLGGKCGILAEQAGEIVKNYKALRNLKAQLQVEQLRYTA